MESDSSKNTFFCLLNIDGSKYIRNMNTRSKEVSGEKKRKVIEIETSIKSLDEEKISDNDYLEQIYFGPRFINADLKIVYRTHCYNVHSAVLCNHSKYFCNLLESQKPPFEIIKLPDLQHIFGSVIDPDRVKQFFEVIYSNENVIYSDFFRFDDEPIPRWRFNSMVHLAHYFQCEKLEKDLQTIVKNWSFASYRLWDFLLAAQTYNWPTELQNKVIEMIGKKLISLRTNNHQKGKSRYDSVWPKLSRKTVEEIYEIALISR